MTLLQRLFGTKPTKSVEVVPTKVAPTQVSISSGDCITQLADGANLVDGKQTWEFAGSDKGDLKVMLKCCKAEMATMKRAKVVAAPFYFERAAILFRKAKQYDREIAICESYIEAVEHYYASVAKDFEADVRKGPRFQAIKSRIAKARALQAKVKSWRLTLSSTRTPPALPSAPSHPPASSASFSTSVQAWPVSFIR